MSRRQWILLLISLAMALIVSISVEPLLPWWIAPPLILLIVVGAAVHGELALSTAAAIWGGLALDLLAPTHLGLRWLSLLMVTLAVHESRRFVAIRDLPWLWPIWFGLAGLLASLPLALFTYQLPLALRAGITSAIWGPLALMTVQWMIESRRSHE